MKLLTFVKNGVQTLGIKVEQGIIDVGHALEIVEGNYISKTITELIEGGEEAFIALQNYIATLPIESAYLLKEEDLQFAPCVTHPSKILCIGVNYRKHADETNTPYPSSPVVFGKFTNALSAHQGVIPIPKEAEKMDHEVELCVVIGKKARYVTKEEALQYVFGYCTGNDVTARDLQKKTSQWLIGKSCDQFSPIGPYLVTADEIEDPQNLTLTTSVNGEIRQNSTTADMIFPVAELISYISQYITLLPGDILFTGTPEGVIFGRPKEMQVFLKCGDSVTVEVGKLGKLTNTFIAH